MESNSIFEQVKKKVWANLPIIILPFTQKTVTKLAKIGVWDPGQKGVKKAPDSATLVRSEQKTNDYVYVPFDYVHDPLKGHGCVPQATGHPQQLREATGVLACWNTHSKP